MQVCVLPDDGKENRQAVDLGGTYRAVVSPSQAAERTGRFPDCRMFRPGIPAKIKTPDESGVALKG